MTRIRSLMILALVALVPSSLLAEQVTRRYLVIPKRDGMRSQAIDDRIDRAKVRGEFRILGALELELTEDEARELARSGRVEHIEPEIIRHIWDEPRSFDRADTLAGGERDVKASLAQTTPSATSQARPFGIDMVGAPGVWNYGRGEAIRVAVIDTGIDKSHPDLAPLYRGGWDFVNNDGDPSDDNGHGTHVAGTIAALDNEFGVVGVAPAVDLYALKILAANGEGSNFALIRAVEWAIENRMHIINLSLGADEKSVAEEAAFRKAADAGILSIAASGNAGPTAVGYPAGYSTVVAVGAIDSKQAIASFSQRGTGLELVAPGVAVASTYSRHVWSDVDITFSGGIARGSLMTYSPQETVAGPFVFCGLGKTAEIPASVKGKIALIQRGELTFADKVRNVTAAGAIGAIIYNNVDGDFKGTLGEASPTWLPTFSMSKADGEKLKVASGSVSMKSLSAEYGTLSGTSMATPHVAGVAALVWSLNPCASAASVRAAMIETARQLDPAKPLWSPTFGYGLVDSEAISRKLAPSLLGAPPPSRRRAVSTCR